VYGVGGIRIRVEMIVEMIRCSYFSLPRVSRSSRATTC